MGLVVSKNNGGVVANVHDAPTTPSSPRQHETDQAEATPCREHVEDDRSHNSRPTSRSGGIKENRCSSTESEATRSKNDHVEDGASYHDQDDSAGHGHRDRTHDNNETYSGARLSMRSMSGVSNISTNNRSQESSPDPAERKRSASPEPAAVNECSEIVVVGVPNSARREKFIKPYFEHEKFSGGSTGDVENVEIKEANVFVTLRNGKVAGRLVARSPFVIHDKKVKVKLFTEYQNDGPDITSKGRRPPESAAKSEPIKKENLIEPETDTEETIPVCTRMVELRPGEAQYIQYNDLLSSDKTLKDKYTATIIPDRDSIEIKAPEKILDDVDLLIHKLIGDTERVGISLDKFALELIQKSEVASRVYKKGSTNGMPDLFLHVDQNTCYLLTRDMGKISEIIQLVQSSFSEERIDLTDGCERFTSTDEWKTFKSSATTNMIVNIKETDSVILIQGFVDDVIDVKNKLAKEISQNASTIMKMALTKQQWGLLHKNHNKVDDIKKETVRKTRRRLECILAEEECYLTMDGHPEDVKKCFSNFEIFFNKVANISFTESNKEGLDHYMTKNEIAKNTITALETEYKCSIEIIVKKPEGELITSWKKPAYDEITKEKEIGSIVESRSPRSYDKPASPPSTKLANYITFRQGSVEKFTEADAVVNTVPNKAKTMKDCGVLGRAFCAYIGPDLEGELTNMLPLDCGEVRETDVSAKGLQYKLIIHAGIRTWSEQYSRKALKETIAKSYDIVQTKGLGSIAFPSVGCGLLKFPPKEVYECVNSEAAKRKNIKTYMVVFDKGILDQLEKCVSTDGHGGNRARGTFKAREHGPTRNFSLPYAPNLQIQMLDITQFTGADVLVNTLTDKKSDITKCGALAKAFADKGGSDMLSDISTKMPVGCGDVVSSVNGNLSCKMVLHAGIRQWKGHMTKQVLEKVVEKCFQETTNKGYTSIAFPTIGCGNLKFPPVEVYTVIAHAANKPGRNSIQVYILPFDNSAYTKFQGFLTAATAPPPPTTGSPDILPMEEDNDEDIPPPSDSPVEELSPFSFDTTKTTADSDDVSIRQAAAVTFNICALTKSEAGKVKDKICDHIKKRFLNEIIKHEAVEYLRIRELRNNIYCHGSRQVAIRVDQSKGTIELTGEHDAATDAKHHIELYLKEMEKLLHDDPDYVRLKANKTVFEEFKLKQPSKIPKHWSSFKGGKLVSKVKNKQPVLVAIKEGTKIYGFIEKTIDDLWQRKPIATGIGADAAGLSHASLKITKICRVENPHLWGEYDEQRKKFRYRKKSTGFPPLSGYQGELDVITYDPAHPEMQKWVDSSINERLFFHGTKNKDAVWKQGLDFRMTGDRALFGKGLYLAETPAKADQYADPRDNRRTTGLSMILVRSLLGNPYVAKDKTPHFNRPPCAQCDSYGCGDHNDLYDSVIGTHKAPSTRLQYREYVIYDQNHAYPEYVITYDRV